MRSERFLIYGVTLCELLAADVALGVARHARHVTELHARLAHHGPLHQGAREVAHRAAALRHGVAEGLLAVVHAELERAVEAHLQRQRRQGPA